MIAQELNNQPYRVLRGMRMARSRRALPREGTVTNIADAREKREQKKKDADKALADSRLSTLEEETEKQIAARQFHETDDQRVQAAVAAASAGVHTPGQIMQRATGRFGKLAVGAGSSIPTSASAAEPGGKPPISSGAPRAAAPARSNPASAPAANATDGISAGAAKSAPKNTAKTKDGTPSKKVSNRTYNREKVQALKAAIANGTYTINPQRVADKFIERESPA